MSDRWHVVVVSPGPPWIRAGAERVVAETCKRLKDAFRISIHCTSQSRSEIGEQSWEGLTVKVSRRYKSAYYFSPDLYRALRKEEAALVHAHNHGTLIPLMAMLARRDAVLVVNPAFHKNADTRLNSALRRVYDPWIGGRALRAADLLICSSKTEERVMLGRVPNLKATRVIYNGANIEGIRKAHPFATSRKIVLAVARLVKYKNVHLLLHAMRHLPPVYAAVIVGSGPEERRLRELSEHLNLTDRVQFTGSVPDDEVYRWYRTATVFVHLSRIESFGMTCVEALAAGAPVVANDDKDALKETIDLFSPNILAVDVERHSPEEIAQAIERASQIEVRADLSLFDWSHIANRFAEAYTGLIQAKQNSFRTA